jgi:hypothetical protein
LAGGVLDEDRRDDERAITQCFRSTFDAPDQLRDELLRAIGSARRPD